MSFMLSTRQLPDTKKCPYQLTTQPQIAMWIVPKKPSISQNSPVQYSLTRWKIFMLQCEPKNTTFVQLLSHFAIAIFSSSIVCIACYWYQAALVCRSWTDVTVLKLALYFCKTHHQDQRKTHSLCYIFVWITSKIVESGVKTLKELGVFHCTAVQTIITRYYTIIILWKFIKTY